MGHGALIVRRASAADASASARIYVESWNQGFGHLIGTKTARPDETERFRTEFARDDTRWWVAELDGAVVGFVATGDSRDPVEPGLGELDTIAVDPPHWRRGVGRALMAVAVDDLRDRYDAAVLWTVAGHERGHRFYAATGWAPDGATRADDTEVRFRRGF